MRERDADRRRGGKDKGGRRDTEKDGVNEGLVGGWRRKNTDGTNFDTGSGGAN